MHVSGRITAAQVVELQRVIRAHEFPSPLRWELIDLTHASGAKITGTVVEHAAETDRQFLADHPKFAVAIVAVDPLLFGFARMYEGYMGDAASAVHVFGERHQAISWLCQHGATPEEFPEN